jgi:hypothetical protein
MARSLIWSDLSSLFKDRGFGFGSMGLRHAPAGAARRDYQLAGTAHRDQGRAVVWRGEVNP